MSRMTSVSMPLYFIHCILVGIVRDEITKCFEKSVRSVKSLLKEREAPVDQPDTPDHRHSGDMIRELAASLSAESEEREELDKSVEHCHVSISHEM